MDMSKLIDLTIYLVGRDKTEALGRMPFDSEESARSYADDNGEDEKVYSVTAYIDPSTIEETS